MKTFGVFFFLDKNRNFVKSKYLFDNFQGVTGDRGPVGNQGSRGYPVSLSLCEQKKEYSVFMCMIVMCVVFLFI